MGSDLARDPQRDKESCQKLAPKKRTVLPKHNARRKEDPDQERTMKSERKPPSPGVPSLPEDHRASYLEIAIHLPHVGAKPGLPPQQ